MAKQIKARTGLTGRATLFLDVRVRQSGAMRATGSALFDLAPARPVPPLASTILEMDIDVSATRLEHPLSGPLTGSVAHCEAIHGAGFLFDNRGETPVGITVRNEGTIVQYQAKDLGFAGPDKSVSVEDNAVTIHIPGQTFAPTLSVRFNSAPYVNQTIAEKGYSSTSLWIAWASNDPAGVPIISFDQLLLGASPIALDAGGSITDGGTYSPLTPISEAVEGSGVSVRLHSALATVTRTAGLTWLPRVYFGNSATEALDEAGIKALSDSGLSSSRTGTKAFPAEAGTYKWIVYPSSFGYARPLDDFLDADTNLKVPMQDPLIVEVTNAFAYTTSYYAYRSTNKLSGAINVRVN